MIELVNVTKEYDKHTPLKDINVTINDGDVIAVIGPDGAGKSTFLRILNMLERPTSGQIFIDGEEVTAPGYPLFKVRQKLGMVFQNFNLFNNMSIIENICFASRYVKKQDPHEVYEKGMRLLESVALSKYAFSYPEELSNGKKQRVAIVRTLANDPEVILFDEPTSELDPTMIGEVQSVIKSLAAQGYTMLIATYDMKFAEKIANRVLYLDDGGIYDDDKPEVIFRNPVKEKTRAFIKQMKDLEFEINEFNKDYLPLMSQVDSFCTVNEVPDTEAKKVKAIIEEIAFNIALPIYKRSATQDTSINLRIEYSDSQNDVLISIFWKDLDVDFLREEFEVPRLLISHYANAVEKFENGIRIRVRE